MPPTPRSAEEHARFHAEFVHTHSSPSRKRFELEFGVNALTHEPLSPRFQHTPRSSTSMSPRVNGRLPETTNQVQFRPMESVAAFQPETKFRYMKAPSCASNSCFASIEHNS